MMTVSDLVYALVKAMRDPRVTPDTEVAVYQGVRPAYLKGEAWSLSNLPPEVREDAAEDADPGTMVLVFTEMSYGGMSFKQEVTA